VFEFDLNSLEKIKRKAFQNLGKKEKSNSAQFSPTQPSQAARAYPLCLSATAHPCSLSPFAWWGRSVDAGFPHACAPLSLSLSLSLSALRARLVSVVNRSPSRSLSLAAPWATVSSVFPATTADPCPRARRGDRPRRMPTRLSSYLSTARTRSLCPASFHPLSCSVVAARARWRSAPTVSIVHPARCRVEPSRAPSRGEKLAPVLGFSQFFPVLANFASLEFDRTGSSRPRGDWPIRPRPKP
jgi:hypothetical protein